MGVPRLWGSHVVVRGEPDRVHKESSLKMESGFDSHTVMLRYYSLTLVSPLPAPWSWHRAPQWCHQAWVRLPWGLGARAKTQQCGKGGPKGPVGKKPLLPCSPKGMGWRLEYLTYLEASSQLVPSRSCWPRQDWGWWQGGTGWRLCWVMASCACTSALAGKLPSSSAVPSRCSGAFVPLSTGSSLLLHQKIGKGNLNKGATAVGCHLTLQFSVWLLKGDLHFLLQP